MQNLKKKLIRLGSKNPSLRKDLKPILNFITSSSPDPVLVQKAKKIIEDARRDLGHDLGGFSVVDLLADNIDVSLSEIDDILKSLGEKTSSRNPRISSKGDEFEEELKSFGTEVKKLRRVQTVTSIANGINVYVEDEPIFVFKSDRGYYREDFTVMHFLGRTIREAVQAFDKMLDTPFDDLNKKSNSQRLIHLGSSNPKLRKHLKPILTKISKDFQRWMQEVDRHIENIAFVSSMDLPDAPYRDWFDSGMSSKKAARKALKRAGF